MANTQFKALNGITSRRQFHKLLKQHFQHRIIYPILSIGPSLSPSSLKPFDANVK